MNRRDVLKFLGLAPFGNFFQLHSQSSDAFSLTKKKSNPLDAMVAADVERYKVMSVEPLDSESIADYTEFSNLRQLDEQLRYIRIAQESKLYKIKISEVSEITIEKFRSGISIGKLSQFKILD